MQIIPYKRQRNLLFFFKGMFIQHAHGFLHGLSGTIHMVNKIL